MAFYLPLQTATLEYPNNDSITTKTHILTYVIGQDASPARTYRPGRISDSQTLDT